MAECITIDFSYILMTHNCHLYDTVICLFDLVNVALIFEMLL